MTDLPIQVSNPDKELYPGVTKKDFVQYYVDVADALLPHIRGRPLSLRRYPDGYDSEGFFQKDTPDWMGDAVRRIGIAKGSGKQVRYALCDTAECLAILANSAALEIHGWLSTEDAVEKPDRLVFDLDPPEGADFDDVRQAARDLKGLLGELGMTAFPMLTGSKGVHVIVALDRDETFETAKKVSRTIAEVLARRSPDRYTVEHRKNKRQGRIFIDYLRNEHGQTAIVPYSTRARKNASVATPITWDELGSTHSDAYTMDSVRRRLAQRSDPLADIRAHSYSLQGLRKRLLAGND